MNRVKQLRQERKLSLREMGDIFNIAFTSIGKMERGTQHLTDEDIKAFCEYFDVTADYLLGLSDMRKYIVPEPINLTKKQFEILDKLDDLDEEGLKELNTYISFLVSKYPSKEKIFKQSNMLGIANRTGVDK